MSEIRSIDKDFLQKITEIIEENISDEQFGVSELAEEIGMSRSNLLRKVKKLTDLSVSQFIRNVRLEHSREMMQDGTYNVSQVSYKVGFSSTSYFIKCFREYFGYPPGKIAEVQEFEKPTENPGVNLQCHQLAAIMFADIEGYTSMMQQDEGKAIQIRNRHREVFNSVTSKYNGKILQYYGDGTLSTFSSAIDAVRCAIEIQLNFLEEPQVPVRIGIHSGDIIFSDDGVIGDGVNVAARIEALAYAGSVFISEKIYDEIKNQPAIKTLSLGEFQLKNVGKPVEIFVVSNPGLAVPGRDEVLKKDKISKKSTERKNPGMIVGIYVAAVLVAVLLFVSVKSVFFKERNAEKSIAVLPFKNDSNDSTNVYFINGLMESTLNNLQKIQDLRVISRTSVEKYRNSPKTSPEIARELGVNFLVEGSGQKVGNKILLNIQLIDAKNDKHLWAEQYNRETGDIFSLQGEVAKNIAEEIEVIVSPEVQESINKIPTDNLEAYDIFLKGTDILNKGLPENARQSIPYLRKAIEMDGEFARAYAALAMAYYTIDESRAIRLFTDSINYYADRAMFYDSKLPQSLIAKGLFYMNSQEYELAVPYFEKALEYNPNYDLVFVFLLDLYVNHLPNTEKYLEYALRGLKIDISSYDSTIASFNYLHIANAFIQAGFQEEAEKYINKSLAYYPGNLYSAYTKAYIVFAGNKDLIQTRDLLLETYKRDTSRLDIMQEVGKIYYYLQDYENAYNYYRKFIDIRKAYNLNIYYSENAKIGYVFNQMGFVEEGEKLLEEFKIYTENDNSVYKHTGLALYYSYKSENAKAIEQLKLFSEESNYFYWVVLFTPIEPLFENINDFPEFKSVTTKIENNFWEWHQRIKDSLQKKGLL
ncbi:helix-turn-helix domain-containing protein [Maribellus comscasis]|uniref:Helix-turn-helix domain-containing protein n=1 Tax=Maribellus comscasis TaxID=2681766 RepID=A0A6I6JV25_9BACT|nr:helix-turn-helix domain-containing protein [Maribellus comscasis]QGY43992.1 helix-turn-helix domain-containing protein [Maribellus comscasis]